MMVYRELTRMQTLPLEIGSLLVMTAAIIILIHAWTMQIQWRCRIYSGVLAVLSLALTQGLADVGMNLEQGFSLLYFSAVVGGIPWVFLALAILVIGFAEVEIAIELRRKRKDMLAPDAIREALDALPDGICFYAEDGQPLLVNEQMHKLGGELTGAEIMNGKTFFESLKSREIGEETGVIRKEPGVVVRTGDGKVWNFHRNELKAGGRKIKEITAYDVTKQDELCRELDERNQTLGCVNERLRKYSREIEKITREKEILNAKVRVHDDVGRSLLAFRAYLAQPQEKRDREQLLLLWHHTIAVMMNEAVSPESGNSDWELLLEAAKAVDVMLIRDGELPKDKENRAVLISAVHECLTNVVKHADGSRLYIRIWKEGEKLLAEFTNDGRRPLEEIKEKGGLADLRHMVESAGGSMAIQSIPRFVLQVALPKGDEVK